MFKLFVVCLLFAVANAGIIGHGAEVISHGAVSTINTNLAAYNAVPVAVAHAAPVAVAAHAAPLAVAAHAAPVAVVSAGHGFGVGLGGHGW